VRLIGYWRNLDSPDWPDPGKFVDTSWCTATRDAVVAYLRNGQPFVASAGSSWCRFRCKGLGARGLGSEDLSDGRFFWPSGLAHYVETHGVRLPDEFVDSMRLPPETIPSSSSEGPPTDSSWWCLQSGFGSNCETHLSPAPIGNLYVSLVSGPCSRGQLARIRSFATTHNRSLPEVRSVIESGARFLLLSGVYEADLSELRGDLEGLGLATYFASETHLPTCTA